MSEVAHNCNPSTQEAEAGELQVQDQPGLHSETLSQNFFKKIQDSAVFLT
jgi:hypothetical protein